MSETNAETSADGYRTNSVAIAAIIVAGIVILACIVGCTTIAIAFIINAPW